MNIASKRVSRANCSNCTCSPGLLSRTNRRSSVMARRITKRNLSGSSSPNGSRKGSVFTLDAASLCLPENKEVNTSERLKALRDEMKKHDIAVYIIPSEDEHQSEYVSAKDQRRSFISGFSGSAGIAVVTRDVMCMNDVPEGLAAVSTDGRYFNQASNELDFNWTLLKQGVPGVPNWYAWAAQQAAQMSLDSGDVIKMSVDPKLISYLTASKLKNAIEEEMVSRPGAKLELIPSEVNLIDAIWSKFEEVPEEQYNIIKTLSTKYTGEEVLDKIARVARVIESKKAHGLVVSSLDEIAWLLNLRGSDISFNPVFYSYAIVTKEKEVTLFANNKKFNTDVSLFLSSNNVEVKPYEEFFTHLAALSLKFEAENKTMIINNESSSWSIVSLVKCPQISVNPSLIEDLKLIKNNVELDGAKKAHLKDGRALVRFFAWLERELVAKTELIDEIEADEQLTSFRKEEEDFVGLSFDTISASGANGAVIHYKPTKGYSSTIDPSKIYLNDSGSQFLDGTTDTTRTVHFGSPKAEEVRNYTLVLKGNIALGSLKFPENTTGTQIDSIARQFLWNYGLDYGHGTSHGIGAFLNVHEGPVGIGPRPNSANPLKPGHLISNEPGYYEDGEYGIRIENVMFVKETGQIYGGKKFLEFETVTRVPFCRRLIDTTLLSTEEKNWINKYHQTIWNELSASFTKNSLEYTWLKRETAPL